MQLYRNYRLFSVNTPVVDWRIFGGLNSAWLGSDIIEEELFGASTPPTTALGKIKVAGTFVSLLDRKVKVAGTFVSVIGFKVKSSGTFINLI